MNTLNDLETAIKKIAKGMKLDVGVSKNSQRLSLVTDEKSWLRMHSLVNHEGSLQFMKLNCITAFYSEGALFLSSELSSPIWKFYLNFQIVIKNEKNIPSLASLWPYAEIFEMEVFEMFGLEFDRANSNRNLILRDSRQPHPLKEQRTNVH